MTSTDIAVPATLVRALITGDFMSDEEQRSARGQLFVILCQRAPGVARNTVADLREQSGEFPAWDLLDAIMPLPPGIDELTATFMTTWHQKLESRLRDEGFPMPFTEPSTNDSYPLDWRPRSRLKVVEQNEE